MNTTLWIITELVAAPLILATVWVFMGWKQATRAVKQYRAPEEVKIGIQSFPDVDLRPGGITNYTTEFERARIEHAIRFYNHCP